MSKESKNDRTSLIRSGNQGLTTRSTNLVRRGLSCLSALKVRKTCVAIFTEEQSRRIFEAFDILGTHPTLNAGKVHDAFRAAAFGRQQTKNVLAVITNARDLLIETIQILKDRN